MIDIAKITVIGGAGGNGCVSFRREKFVPRGGPDGGDGGHGGSVYVVGDASINTLLHLRYNSRWKGSRGVHGRGQNRRGANGEDVRIKAPLGTVIWKLGEGERVAIAEVWESGEELLVARGGHGGSGNARFATATQQEPLLAEKGTDGERGELLLELKLLADVGIVGKPNAGKSTLMSVCSRATPKVAAYPFTTTEPVLGVIDLGRDSEPFVMMEVPGLIQGAHEGSGLGHDFLRHAERAKLLLHLVDGSGDDPAGDMRQINRELKAFDQDLGAKPQIIVVNKVDIPDVRELGDVLQETLSASNKGGPAMGPVHLISAATGEGVNDLMLKVVETLNALPQGAPRISPMVPKTAAEPPAFTVTRRGGTYHVAAPKVERMLPLADLRDWRVMIQVWKQLRDLGVADALEEMGVRPGDTVQIGRVELEWH